MIEIYTVAMFGEAEKGKYRSAYFLKNLPQLVDNLGNPPQGSEGLHFAVQTLMYKRQLIFFRVKEEGYSSRDYFKGLQFLKKKNLKPNISAICLPGVGDAEIINRAIPICKSNNSILIISEPDLYDYLTAKPLG